MPEEIDISPKQDKGVLKEIIKEGEGTNTPPNGSKVKVHYTGTLLDGTKFDSSRDRDQPFEFDLGKGKVIKAWDIGVATMKKGEQAMITCASEYAYGETGSPPTIPPNATLKFDVEVIDWIGEDLSPSSDGSIERIIVKEGTGFTNPNEGAFVDIHLEGKFEGKVFDERDVQFNLGEAEDVNVIEGIEKALESFKKKEVSTLIIKPKYAFGSTGNAEFGIPPNATVEYTVTLKTFEMMKDSWSLDSTEKIELSKQFKDKGTAYFKQAKYPLAIKMYNKVLSYLEYEKSFEGNLAEERESLLLGAHLNLSLCHLKHNNAFEAKNSATEALKIDANNEKAYFRRGQALLILKEAQLAANDFAALLKIEPNNKAAQAQLAACNKILKEQLQKEKKIYANMFAKFAKMDTQVTAN